MINLYQHALVYAIFRFNCSPMCAVISNIDFWGIYHISIIYIIIVIIIIIVVIVIGGLFLIIR